MHIQLSQHDICQLLIDKINKYGVVRSVPSHATTLHTTSANYRHPVREMEDSLSRPQLITTVEYSSGETIDFKFTTLNSVNGRCESVKGSYHIEQARWLGGLNPQFICGDEMFKQMFIELLTSGASGWEISNRWINLYYNENYVCF